MVKQIECYEDSTGKVHKVALDAYRADLAYLLFRSDDVSETSAQKLADRLIGSPEELDELMETLKSIRAEITIDIY